MRYSKKWFLRNQPATIPSNLSLHFRQVIEPRQGVLPETCLSAILRYAVVLLCNLPLPKKKVISQSTADAARKRQTPEASSLYFFDVLGL